MGPGVRYRVHRKIARGGMAEIFLASQIGLEGFEKTVVLKRILPALAAEPGFLRMLLDEAHIVSGLNHTNLVQVLDLWRSDGQFFLVLEFVDGWSLEEVRLRAAKVRLKLPLHLALSITSSLCRALHYVHRHTRNGEALGIVHRDVTPQNVLLSREGDVKLADFGIAKAVGRREKSAIGVIKGKFAYMSPEQSIGAELDARSDLFSVGSMLYVLTTGHKPFGGKTDLDTLMQVRRARHQKPSAHVRDFNPDVERFIERALRADRARRWQTAEQMADRLDTILVKLGQPSGPAALKRWLTTLSARDGILPPGERRDPAVEPPTNLIELSSSAHDLQRGTRTRSDGEEEIGTRAMRPEDATQALSEFDIEIADEDERAAAMMAAVAAENATVTLHISDLHEDTPLPLTPSAEAANDCTPPRISGVADVATAPTAAVEPEGPSGDGAAAPPAPTPAIEQATVLAAPASRRAALGRMGRMLRRGLLAAVVLSLLLGSGFYVASPLLPEWTGSATFTRWVDHWFARLPQLLHLLNRS